MAVAPRPIVERFDVFRDVGVRDLSISLDLFLMCSFFKLLKNDSAIASSQQLPRRLMLGSRCLVRQNALPNVASDPCSE